MREETDRQRERDMTLEQYKPNPKGHTVSALTHHFISVSDTWVAATAPYQTTNMSLIVSTQENKNNQGQPVFDQ